jgi:hypothetical protein
MCFAGGSVHAYKEKDSDLVWPTDERSLSLIPADPGEGHPNSVFFLNVNTVLFVLSWSCLLITLKAEGGI